MAFHLRHILSLAAVTAATLACMPLEVAGGRAEARSKVVASKSARSVSAQDVRHVRIGKRTVRSSSSAKPWTGGGWAHYRYEPMFRISPAAGTLLWSSYPYPGGGFFTGSVRRPFGYDRR